MIANFSTPRRPTATTRIESRDGIDWEVEDPDDPWSYIGYWGDHQIIYLLKLLELSQRFHPRAPRRPCSPAHLRLRQRALSDQAFRNACSRRQNTVVYDAAAANDRAAGGCKGADGKLTPRRQRRGVPVNLVEKLLVPRWPSSANFVPDGGIWLNTQRPEWNDANNALVGHGLSMVTLYYMRRYSGFPAAFAGPGVRFSERIPGSQ